MSPGVAGPRSSYLKRGDRVTVKGRLTNRKWADKYGEVHQVEIVVEEVTRKP